MLSAQFIRENLDRVKRDMARRNTDVPIDHIVELDASRRALLGHVEELRAEKNVASKAIGQTRDAEERERRIVASREIGDRLAAFEEQIKAVEPELEALLLEVPNVLAEEVPDGRGEEDNVVLSTHGDLPGFDFEPKTHWEIGEALNGIDFERGVKMSGTRFYVLKGQVARLHRALTQWMLNLHIDEGGFEEYYLPYMMTEASFFASGHLPKFRDNLYRDAEEDYLFVPTAEAPFANLYRDEILPARALPQRLVAHTPCFRREKMSAGRDTRGLKRVHQFEKVEMFVFCEPGQSEAEHQGLLARAKSIPERLGLPHRVLELCSAEIDFKAAKGFDIEIWSPGVQEWLEVSSVSNCTDFQARRANIRYRPEQGSGTAYPHMLNGSGLAPGRALIAVLENFQQADGSVAVPEALRPYTGTDRLTPPA